MEDVELGDLGFVDTRENNENHSPSGNRTVARNATMYYNKKTWLYAVYLDGYIYRLNQERQLFRTNDDVLPQIKEFPERTSIQVERAEDAVTVKDLQALAEAEIVKLQKNPSSTAPSSASRKSPFFSAAQTHAATAGLGARSEVAHGKNINPEFRELLGVHAKQINVELKPLHYSLDATNTTLVNQENGRKIKVTEKGDAVSDLYEDLTDEATIRGIVNDMLAIATMWNELYRATRGECPKGENNLGLIRENLNAEQLKEVDEKTNPVVKERVKKALLADAKFEGFRDKIKYDGEFLFERAEEKKAATNEKPLLKSALFCIDFDKTISGEHLHNLLMKFTEEHEGEELTDEDLWQHIKDVPLIGSAEELKTVVETLKADGHDTAIVSFNGFKNIVERYLREKIGLDATFMKENLNVVAYYPKQGDPNTKERHIALANAELGYPPENIVLVDDTKRNTDAAKLAGHQTILATADGAHFKEILAKSKAIKEHGVPRRAPAESEKAGATSSPSMTGFRK